MRLFLPGPMACRRFARSWPGLVPFFGRISDVLGRRRLLALEIGDGQAERVVEMIEGRGEHVDVRIVRDLAGKQRVVRATRVDTTTRQRGM